MSDDEQILVGDTPAAGALDNTHIIIVLCEYCSLEGNQMKKFVAFFIAIFIFFATLLFGWLAFTANRPLTQIGGILGFIFGVALLYKITGEPKTSTWEEIDKISRDGGYW